jgi:YD repeat-containing protein
MVALVACGQRGDQSEETPTNIATTSEALNNTPPKLGWPAQPVVTGRTVGTLGGSGRVNPMGTYEYSLPLEVPPGRAGMAPKISLDYSSTAPDGLLGVGWSLGGLSAIHPCDYSIATDGVAASDDTQGVCLDGNRIIKERTESDIVAKIVDNKTVYLKNGRIRTYGAVGPANYAVLLSEQDRSGNSITYVYWQSGKLTDKPGPALDLAATPGPGLDADAIEIRLAQILYTGRVSADDTGSRIVDFAYEPRPDPIYVEHSLVNPYGAIGTTQRLNKITMSAPAPTGTGTAVGPATEVWHYDLLYLPSTTSGRSLLNSVTQTGALGGKKFAKIFDWTSTQGGNYDNNNLLFPTVDPAQGAIALDVDNDGRDEMIVETQPGLTMLWSTPVGAPMLSQVKPLTGLVNATLKDASIGDLDGDGVPEIIAPNRIFDAAGNKAYGVYKWSPALQDYALASVNPGGRAYITAQNVEQPIYLADMDGDGLPDLVQAFYDPIAPLNLHPDFTCVNGTTASRPRCLGYFWVYAHNNGGTFGPASMILSSSDAAQSTDSYGNVSYVTHDYPPMSGSPFSSFQLPERGGRTILFAASDDFAGILAGFRLIPGADTPKFDFDHTIKSMPLCALGDFRGRGGPDFECFDPKQAGFASSDPFEWTVHNFDVDGDGRDDLVAYRSISPFSVQHGYYVHYDVNGVKTTLPLSRVPVIGGDFDGDGRRDIYGYDIANSRVFVGSSLPTADLLTGEHDENAAVASEVVTYTQQWSATPVTAKACVHPQRCIRHGLTVVQSLAVNTGSGLVETDYNYDDPRYDVFGRGFLGFGTVREWTSERPSETITTYDNVTSNNGVYFAFLPKMVRKYVPIDQSLKRKDQESVNVRASQVTLDYAIDFNGKSFLRHPINWESEEWEPVAQLDWTPGIAEHFGGFVPSAILRTRFGAYAYDAYGNETSVLATTAKGDTVIKSTTYENRTADWLIGLPQTVLTSETGPSSPLENRKVEYVHDPLGRVQKVFFEKGDVDPELPETLTYEFNSDGLPLTVTAEAVGEVPRHTYTQYDPDEGIFERKTWNDLGHAAQTLVHPVFGIPSNTLDPNGVGAKTTFDEFGRVRQVAQTNGPTVDTYLDARVDSQGYVIGSTVTTQGAGVVSTYAELDVAGHNVLVQHTGFDGTPIVQTIKYDRLGRVVFESRPGFGNPDSHGTTYLYDSLDRKYHTVLPDLTPIEEKSTFFEHQIVDGEGHERHVLRDIEGRVSSSVQGSLQGSPGTQPLVTTFTYGNFHQLIATTDPLKHVTTITYDKRGRRKQITDPDTGVSTTHYNGFGEVTSIESPSVNNSSTPALAIYTHDTLGRVTQLDNKDGAALSTTKLGADTGLHRCRRLNSVDSAG